MLLFEMYYSYFRHPVSSLDFEIILQTLFKIVSAHGSFQKTVDTACSAGEDSDFVEHPKLDMSLGVDIAFGA